MTAALVVPPAGVPETPRIRLRRARLRDVRALVQIYRGQSPQARSFYHPFPFDPVRLVPIFLWMVGTTPYVRFWLRHLPSRAAYVVVVTGPDDDRPIGYGTVRFVVEPGQAAWAKFGYLVSEGRRGQGIGSLLAVTQVRCARGLGLRRGGGYVLRGNSASAGVVEKFGYPLSETSPDRHTPPGTVNLISIGNLDEMIAHFETGMARERPGAARIASIDAHLRTLGWGPEPPADAARP